VVGQLRQQRQCAHAWRPAADDAEVDRGDDEAGDSAARPLAAARQEACESGGNEPPAPRLVRQQQRAGGERRLERVVAGSK
jgi:hypothetical protein